MTQSGPAKSARLFFLTVTIAVAILGIFFLVDALKDLVHFRGIIVNLFEIAFAVLCFFVVYRSYVFRSAKSVRWLFSWAALVAFWLLFIGTNWISIKIAGPSVDFFETRQADDPKTAILGASVQLISAITVLVLYRLVLAWLLPRLALVDDRTAEQRIWSAKLSLMTIAILIFTSGSEMSHAVRSPSVPPDSGPRLWDTLTIVGPIVLAITFYKVGLYLAARHFRREHLLASKPSGSIAIGA